MSSRRSSVLSLVFIPFALIVACGGSQVAIGENDQKLVKNPDGSSTGNGQTCTVGGVTVGVGQAFKSPDGCNDCKCAAEGAYCTVRACAGDGGTGGGQQCKGSDGKIHNAGDSYPSGDGCNTCSCTANGEVCTLRACKIDCSAKGACAGPAPGMPNWTCADGSIGGPVCSDVNGTCGWKINQCVCKDANGGVHNAGDTWTDGCNNSCSCDQQGQAACTAMACTCPPNGTINCMPPVPTTRASVCSGPYHTWVVANCPGVNFVY